MTTEIRTCHECGTRIGGRADKKYCSDACRINHNNRLNANETSYMRSVNHALRKNRRILMELNPDGKSKVPLQRLKTRGFDFSHFTSTAPAPNGSHYFYCYEQGYTTLKEDVVMLVVRKDL